MQKTIKTLAIIILSSVTLSAQNKVMNFDGVNDYVDLGSSVGTGIRTIEMWFKPGISINSTLQNFKGLIARDITTTNANEFNISFVKNSIGPSVAGKLRFGTYDNNSILHAVYSNNNNWSAGRWYHVAAVIHPTQGMMLFINGVKQNSTNSYNSTLSSNNAITTLGSWGSATNRYFNGKVDDLRLSDSALYSSNFSPSCPDLGILPSTIGVWNFNDSPNASITIDSSSNVNHGTLYGAIGTVDTICQIATGLQITKKVQSNIRVFPNPFNNQVKFTFNYNKSASKRIRIFSIDGKLVVEKLATSSLIIETNSFVSGMYFYQVLEEGKVIYSNKLIKE